MNWSKLKLKKICTVYKLTDSYHFNGNHNAYSYIKTIQSLLDKYHLLDNSILSGYIHNKYHFIASFVRMNPLGDDIVCEINFETTTLTITVKE